MSRPHSARLAGVVNPLILGSSGRRHAPAKPVHAPNAALPCLNSNNSIEPESSRLLYEIKAGFEYAGGKTGSSLLPFARQCEQHGVQVLAAARTIGKARLAGDEAEKTAQGRYKVQLEDGSIVALGTLNNAEKKTAFCLRENVKALADAYGLNRLGFLTLTFPDPVTDTKEAQRRFNSLATNFLRKTFPDWLMVVEPQGQRGNAVHYHLLVVCPEDIRTGFDFEAIKARDYRSASATLRGVWSTLRDVLPRYGFGRSELLPIKSTQEGIAKYVGKYISKGCGDRLDGWEGARLVRYSTRTPWRKAFVNFAWNSDGSKQWRELVAEVAHELHAEDMAGIARAAGKRWAFHLKQRVDYCKAMGEVSTPADYAQFLRMRWRICVSRADSLGPDAFAT